MIKNKKVLAAVERAETTEFAAGYLLHELTGITYQRAIRHTIRHMREEHGLEFEHVPQLLRFADQEQMTYNAQGELIGGWLL